MNETDGKNNFILESSRVWDGVRAKMEIQRLTRDRLDAEKGEFVFKNKYHVGQYLHTLISLNDGYNDLGSWNTIFYPRAVCKVVSIGMYGYEIIVPRKQDLPQHMQMLCWHRKVRKKYYTKQWRLMEMYLEPLPAPYNHNRSNIMYDLDLNEISLINKI